MEHNFYDNFIEDKIVPFIIEFVDKYCPLNKLTNNEKDNNQIIIDFDEELYKFPKNSLKFYKVI